MRHKVELSRKGTCGSETHLSQEDVEAMETLGSEAAKEDEDSATEILNQVLGQFTSIEMVEAFIDMEFVSFILSSSPDALEHLHTPLAEDQDPTVSTSPPAELPQAKATAPLWSQSVRLKTAYQPFLCGVDTVHAASVDFAMAEGSYSSHIFGANQARQLDYSLQYRHPSYCQHYSSHNAFQMCPIWAGWRDCPPFTHPANFCYTAGVGWYRVPLGVPVRNCLFQNVLPAYAFPNHCPGMLPREVFTLHVAENSPF